MFGFHFGFIRRSSPNAQIVAQRLGLEVLLGGLTTGGDGADPVGATVT